MNDGSYNIHGDATVLKFGCVLQDGCGTPLEHGEVQVNLSTFAYGIIDNGQFCLLRPSTKNYLKCAKNANECTFTSLMILSDNQEKSDEILVSYKLVTCNSFYHKYQYWEAQTDYFTIRLNLVAPRWNLEEKAIILPGLRVLIFC